MPKDKDIRHAEEASRKMQERIDELEAEVEDGGDENTTSA